MKLSTFFILAGMFIISLYFLIDVNYYANIQNASENKTNTPYLVIPKIGVNEKINNQSVSYGIYHDPKSAKPGFGTVVLHGHRTLYGSPFLNLEKLQKGDNITLEWPGIGNVEYKVERSFIVPSSYRLSVEQGNVLFLATCYPLGSTKERLIIEAKLEKIYPFENKNTSNSTKKYYAIIMICIFLGAGLSLTYFYPVEEDKIIIFIATLTLTLFLLCGFLFPIPPDYLASKLSDISNFLGV
ncbi:MAG: class E sortase [Euryarchaeota archaeon]|nr:class E sortase [Euryarchaeota archaeon]